MLPPLVKGSLQIGKLILLQKQIACKLVLKDVIPLDSIRFVCGLDAAYSRIYKGVAVATLIDIHNRKLIDANVALGTPPLQYIPGLLAFREAPIFYTALRPLLHQCQVVVVDGHGISHPRKAGIATHIGMAIKKPTIGVAKSKLAGTIKVVDGEKYVELQGQLVAKVLVHRNNELYVSPGAYITLSSAVKIIERLLEPDKSLPLPTYYADTLSKILARKLDKRVIEPKTLKQHKLMDILRRTGLLLI